MNKTNDFSKYPDIVTVRATTKYKFSVVLNNILVYCSKQLQVFTSLTIMFQVLLKNYP